MTTPYRVLVTGSRDWDNPKAVRDALWNTLISIPANRQPVVVHGDCPTGADHTAKMWVRTYGNVFGAREEAHPANWNEHGKAAGPIRNAHMVSLGADICLAFIRNGSRGASHTVTLAEQAGIPVRRWTS